MRGIRVRRRAEEQDYADYVDDGAFDHFAMVWDVGDYASRDADADMDGADATYDEYDEHADPTSDVDHSTLHDYDSDADYDYEEQGVRRFAGMCGMYHTDSREREREPELPAGDASTPSAARGARTQGRALIRSLVARILMSTRMWGRTGAIRGRLRGREPRRKRVRLER
ncbi:hypothetical protein DFH09DRAFT_1169363 [Mycena vulgaris]|nr:hypothetical protein DFH09DRAFT_1169363 [Mycena vulgaris]